MKERTREGVQLVLAGVVVAAWLVAILAGRDVALVTPPLMAVMAWAFYRPGEPVPGPAENAGSSSR